MYALNPLKRKVLISPAEVLLNISADAAVAYDKVQFAIEIAEERFIRPALGWDLYEELIDKKNIVITEGNKATYQPYINATLAGTQAYVLKAGDIVNASELLTDDQKKLWDTFLCKVTAEAVQFIAIPENYAQFGNQGIMRNNPSVPVVADNNSNTSASVGINEAKWLMDKWQERIGVLLDSMHQYICKNITPFAKYGRATDCGCGTNTTENKPAGGWVFPSIYNDEEDRCC